MKAVKFGKRAAGLNVPDIYRQYLFERIQKILLGHLAGSHQLALTINRKANDVFLVLQKDLLLLGLDVHFYC